MPLHAYPTNGLDRERVNLGRLSEDDGSEERLALGGSQYRLVVILADSCVRGRAYVRIRHLVENGDDGRVCLQAGHDFNKAGR